MSPQISDTLGRFEVYSDEINRGFMSLARIYYWITGIEFTAKERDSGKEIEIPKLQGGKKCYLPTFTNSMKSVHYLHEMSNDLLHIILLEMSNAPLENWMNDEVRTEYESITTQRAKIDFLKNKGVIKERDEWMFITEKVKTWAGITLGITSKLKLLFVETMQDSKYGGELETKDIKKYLDKNKKLNCGTK